MLPKKAFFNKLLAVILNYGLSTCITGPIIKPNPWQAARLAKQSVLSSILDAVEIYALTTAAHAAPLPIINREISIQYLGESSDVRESSGSR